MIGGGSGPLHFDLLSSHRLLSSHTCPATPQGLSLNAASGGSRSHCSTAPIPSPAASLPSSPLSSLLLVPLKPVPCWCSPLYPLVPTHLLTQSTFLIKTIIRCKCSRLPGPLSLPGHLAKPPSVSYSVLCLWEQSVAGEEHTPSADGLTLN